MARVALDTIPDVSRPGAVATALAEAVALRDKHREATGELAASQQALEQAQTDDVAATAQKIRAGTQPGAVATAATKARQTLELAERNAAAIRLATDGAEDDLGEAMREHAQGWLAALDQEADDARQHGFAAVAAVEDAAARVGDAAAAAAWLRGALVDDRFDRRVGTMLAGRVARSSARLTINSEPLTTADLVGYLREALGPPIPTAASAIEATTAQA